MRRYYIVTGILQVLVLSIIDSALAAPVLVQEKRQASVDLVHKPREVITVLGNRGLEGMGKPMEELVETSEKPAELSDAHTSSSSALPMPDHGLTNEAGAPASNPASSPTNPDPLMEPSSVSSTADLKPVAQQDALSESDDESDYEWLYNSDHEPIVPINSPSSTEFDSDRELTEPLTEPYMPSSNRNPNENYWPILEDQPSSKRPKLESSNEFGQAHDDQQVVHKPLPNPDHYADLTDWFGSDLTSWLDDPRRAGTTGQLSESKEFT